MSPDRLNTAHLQEFEERPQHECGIGLIYTYLPSNKRHDLIDLGTALQHRGQNGAGFVTDRFTRGTVGNGLLDKAFIENDLQPLEEESTWAMIHLRYGTTGGYSELNLQPITFRAQNGDSFHMAVNGNLPYMEKFRALFGLDQDVSDTYISALLLSKIATGDWDEAIREFSSIPEIEESANNMLIGVGANAYVIRDKYGVHPLVMGDYHGQGMVFTSETVALQKIGARVVREFPRGGIVKMDRYGAKTLKQGTTEPGNACIFEPAYFSSPNSHLMEEFLSPSEWMSVMRFRNQCGAIAAHESPAENADMVCGMPDSGVPFANGFSNESRIPYYNTIIRSHYNGEGRTFMMDQNMSEIPRLVRGKLMPVIDRKLYKDKILVIGDDSLVRGNNAMQMTQMMRGLGFAEIHWRIGFPPVQHPCHLGVSFRSHEELLAVQNGGDLRRMAQAVGADSIAYISNEGIIQAGLDNGMPIIPEDEGQIFLENGWCGGCVTGNFPVPAYKEGTVFKSKK